MSEPRAIPDEERPFIPEEGFPEREEGPPEDANIPPEAQPQTQEHTPQEAELGEDGQGDLAPEDEPGTHSGDAPRDLRDQET